MRSRHLRNATPMRRVAVVTSMVAVVIALLSMPSSSAPGDPVPGSEDLPSTPFSLAQGIVTASQGTVVRRSKTYITIGNPEPIWGVFYTNLYNTPVDNPTTYAALCARGRPCISDPFVQPSCATDDQETQERGFYLQSHLYPYVRLKGGGIDVGRLATTRVNLVAFGSIPASVVMTLRLARAGGKVRPIRAHNWVVTRAGCDPSFTARDHNLLVGEVEVTLSDLRVDGVPVNLGKSCRTVRPAQLQMWGTDGPTTDGYTAGGGGTIEAREGVHIAARAPLDSPYYGTDRGLVVHASSGIDIPRFVGCGSNGDDLSPLVTAMASGPNNPVVVNQKSIIPHEGGLDLANMEKCQNDGIHCPLPAPPLLPRPPLPDGDTASR